MDIGALVLVDGVQAIVKPNGIFYESRYAVSPTCEPVLVRNLPNVGDRVIIQPSVYISKSRNKFIGKTVTIDSKADYYVFAEGVGAMDAFDFIPKTSRWT